MGVVRSIGCIVGLWGNTGCIVVWGGRHRVYCGHGVGGIGCIVGVGWEA